VDHELRRARAAAALPALELDALLVTHRPNVRYLTGFSGSSAELLLGRAAAVLLTDGRYAAQAARESPALERRTCLNGFLPAAAEAAAALGDRIGFERQALSFAEWESLREAAAGLELVPTSGLVEALREVKEEDELALIVAAQAAADDAFEEIVLGGGLRAGVREHEVGLALEMAMRSAGADAMGFEPIVAFGENAAEPHHRPGARELRRGDVVTTDFGAAMGGYRSDMTRTVAFGEPGQRLREIYALVASAQAVGVQAVRDGVVAGDVDAAARNVIADAGLADAFSHPVGHAVGLEIHESPILRATCRTMLRAGAVVTVEPGVYLPGVAGVRIEDMVEVTPEGPHVIPRTTKELIVL
jgi:Xaa-Pro aminopeptidase